MLIRARRLLLEAGVFLEDAGFRVERGKIVEVFRDFGARNQAAGAESCVEFEDGLVAPGFVDAHAHLELGRLRGTLDGSSMLSWIRGIVAARRELGQDDYSRAWRAGAERLLATGTTTVGDIDSSGACEAEGAGSALGVVCFREVLDAGDSTRAPAALRRVQRALAPRRGLVEGLSPHAPYTTSATLLEGCAKLLGRRAMPLAIHWAEIEEEHPWVEAGDGPFAEFLGARLEAPSGSLRVLDELGLLSGSTALIHANHPRKGDIELIARRGAHVVHCPGTHRYFGRDPFALDDYVRAGVPLALGTDSLASNEDLDMGREMALLRETHAHLSGPEILAWATVGGARALGLGDRRGRLAEGYDADFVHHAHEPSEAEEAARALAGPGQVRSTWVAGKLAWSKQNA